MDNNVWKAALLQLSFFVGNYALILQDIDMVKLNEQFVNYQILTVDDLPEHIKSACGIDREEEEEKVCRIGCVVELHEPLN